MEALLPSEIARLVLGYLEEEKCGEAAKIFLNSSPHLAEIRLISQRGKKYPTKVNGFSLKDVLDEYCTVHTIVQESISSMSEQPNGTMIECLQSLVKACQPVQVHINLHPHQGQNATSSRSENPELSTFSTRPKSRKISSNGQSFEGNDLAPVQQPMFQILPDSSSNQSPHTVTNSDSSQSSQLAQQTSPLTTCKAQNLQLNQNSNSSMLPNNQMELRIEDNGGLTSHTELTAHHKTNEVSHPNTFQNDNIDSFQEPAPLLTSGHVTSQHLVHVSSATQSSVMQVANSEFTPQSAENVTVPPLAPDTLQRDFSKTEEPVRSYTVTKCFGSNIVILENDSNASQPCLPNSAAFSSNTTEVDEVSKCSRFKLPIPFKSISSQEQLTETALRTGMVTNIVEKLGGAMKTRDDTQEIGEGCNFSGEAVQSVIKQVMEDPCFDQFLEELLQLELSGSYSSSDDSQKQGGLPGERRKHLKKKKIGSAIKKSKHSDNLVTDPGCTPSKVLPEKFLNTSFSFLPDGVTPAKNIVEGDTMTPMTKLLKSITSPSSENYLDPTQFASLIDISGSAVKVKEQSLPAVSEVSAMVQYSQPSSQPSDNTKNVKMIQVPPTVNYVICHSNQQIAQYVNEKGVNTLFTDEIQIAPSSHGVPLLPNGPLTNIPTPKPKRKPPRQKRCTTRGGRQSAGQKHPAPNEESGEAKDTVTLYAADGKDISSTVSYCGSTDMPILVSEVSDEIPQAQHLDTHTSEGHSIQSDIGEVSEEKSHQENVNKSEDMPQPETTHQPVSEGQDVEEPETVDIITEEKDDSFKKDDVLQSVNSSVIRNTPAFSGPRRPLVKRASLSTPRRRQSYVRALDFNTPTKENDQSIRRANTSPKNMSMNALSPRTAGKSGKPSTREGLFKAPDDGSQRTSKAKAHLFKSPEYLMSQSSGFKNPAVTSTPAETNSKSNNNLPSEAWDKVGGVSLILETDISPVKRKEPNCKKTLKPWDAGLRSLLSGSDLPPPPPPIPSRKRKLNAQPAGKKAVKKSKLAEKEDEVKTNESSLNNTQDVVNQSDCEMAKLIECNLMDSSTEAVSPVKQTGMSGVQKLLSPSKPEGGDHVEEMKIDKPEPKRVSCNEEKSDDCTLVTKTEGVSKPTVEPVQVDDNFVATETSEPPAYELASNVPASQAKVFIEDSNSDEKTKTPVPDPAVVAIAEKNRLSQATWKESFSFDTPVKDSLSNMVPQTPRFLDPSTASGEDTPRTKIIKALPFPIVQSVGTPIPTVPPTPTIHATPTVSPNGPTYFQPVPSSPARSNIHTSIRCQQDNLESILIKECSRMEASGIRKVAKKSVVCEVLINSSGGDSDELISSEAEVKVVDPSDENKRTEASKENDEQNGCARLRFYQRKSSNSFKHLVCETFSGFPLSSKSRATTSGEDTDECLIISPNKYSNDQKNKSVHTKVQAQPDAPSTSSSPKENVSSDPPSKPIESTASQLFSNIDGVKIEEALNMLHGVPEKKSTKSTPQKCTTVALSPSKQKSVSKKSLSTPVKPKPQKTKTPSSKKKIAHDESVEQTTDDESSDSSSSDYSSSDSDSNNSSSSSSDESTHVTNTSFVQEINGHNDCNESASAIVDTAASDPNENTGVCLSEEVKEHRPEGVGDTELSTIVEQGQNKDEEIVQDQLKEVVADILPSSENADTGEIESTDSVEAATGKIENIASKNEIPILKSSEPTADENKTEESEPQVESPKEIVSQSKVSSDCVESSKKSCADSKVSVDLKSLIQTKDIGSCEKAAKFQSTLPAGRASVMTELQEKRLRTIAQLKGASVRKHTKKKESTPSDNCSNPAVMQTNISLNSKQVQDRLEEPLTKDIAICKDVPKKRRSKSEADGSACPGEAKSSIPKRRSASDSAKGSSDDEEFKLHLSGDEKEDMQCNFVGAQVLLAENEVAKNDQVTASKSTSSASLIIGCTEKSPKHVSPETSKQSSKFVPKKVSSKAADDVIKALLEKGFNCPLPVLPSERIKKTDPNVKKAIPLKQNVKSVIDSKSSKPTESTLGKDIPSNCNESASNLELADNVDEEVLETVNTSITSYTREVAVKYSGLGPTKPKLDVYPLRSMHIEMDVGLSISLSPSNFFPLYSVNPEGQGSRAESEKRGHRSDFYRTDRVCNIKYVHSQDSRDIRTRRIRDSNSGDRGSRYREDSRSRRNQSPPHRHRRSRDYSTERIHSRDQHRSHSSHDRLKRHNRKDEDASSRRQGYSTSKPIEPPKPSKPINADASSDGELDAQIGRKRVRPFSQKMKQPVRENKSEEVSVSRRRKTSDSSPARKDYPEKKPIHHRIYLIPQGDKRSSSVPKMKASTSASDVDLDDDANFPVLGDDDESSKGTDQNLSKESNSSGGMVLRRAPPRSVNAHKNTPAENQTSSQRGKRKLSTSPDNFSEDSCQSSLSVTNPESKQMNTSRKSKKRLSTTTGKTTKASENENVADCSEIIKNLNVDAFLSKIHG